MAVTGAKKGTALSSCRSAISVVEGARRSVEIEPICGGAESLKNDGLTISYWEPIIPVRGVVLVYKMMSDSPRFP
jgi:hypothetical protein